MNKSIKLYNIYNLIQGKIDMTGKKLCFSLSLYNLGSEISTSFLKYIADFFPAFTLLSNFLKIPNWSFEKNRNKIPLQLPLRAVGMAVCLRQARLFRLNSYKLVLLLSQELQWHMATECLKCENGA